ncbi:Ankyrin repeat domain-containing protein 50 [Penicillium rolfsii]|nr:Ankyrin repeat domain-containing protein 50 [Penicillium rolfsii]
MAAEPTSLFKPNDYTVAWISALPLEMAAAEAMLDERHPPLPTIPGDDNTYVAGRLGSHNLIIACLPAGVYGTTSAANVASQMRLTFKGIRFGLMVGIAGGVPSADHDIRLGDVVVGKPTRDFGGVIQYDYGKAVSGGHLERTGVLNKPPTMLLTAVAALQSAHIIKGSRIPEIISDLGERHPQMREKFTYDSNREDLLFEAEYDHTTSAATCDGCNRERLVTRAPRDKDGPVIHYGLIASGNQVMKDGQTRDQLARDLGILCFEMEAAGLMDTFPCLVIRGICDYADSHKNKQWQEYAATTAAAYAKELLCMVHAVRVSDAPAALLVNDIVHSRRVLAKLRGSSTWLTKPNDDLDETIFKRISTYDHAKVHQRLAHKRVMGTAQWFLDHPDFKAWLIEKRLSRLWCSGKIGSGKTTIATAAIDAAKYRSSKIAASTAYFYCESDRPGELNGLYILSSLIKQLCENLRAGYRRCPDDVVESLNRFFGKKRIVPDFDDLKAIFIQLFHLIPDTVYILDGLDALSPEQSKDLYQLFRSLFCGSGPPAESRILVFSREQLPGYTGIPPFLADACRISTTSNVMTDLQTYIDTSITDKLMSRKLTDDSALLDEVKWVLLEESSGMFLWVYLQLEILWQDCFTDNRIRSALRDLPKDLEETYHRCLQRMTFTNPYSLRVLQWVSFAARPLHIDELREAVAFDLDDMAWDAGKVPQADVVIGCGANLVAVDPSDQCVRFAHPSVKTYLQKNSAWLIPGYPQSDTQGELQCGEFCVAYLSFSNFNLEMVKPANETELVKVPDAKLLAGDALSSPWARFFWGRGANPKKPTQVQFRRIRSAAIPDRSRYKFLDYAVTQWALQTKNIPPLSLLWGKFKQLSLSFNETWNFHPWVVGGRSQISRLHGLFGWAIKNGHMPLLELTLTSDRDIREICNLPLVGERLPALHLASKLGFVNVVSLLLPICELNLQDEEGYTALHHAASKGHEEVLALLLDSRSTKIDIPSRTQVTPLWLAANHGHDNLVWALAGRQANLEAKESSSKRTPLSQAAGNGHSAVVSFLVEKGANLEAEDAVGRTPLSWAVTNEHIDTIEVLLEKGASLDCQFVNKGKLLLWAAQTGHAAITNLLAANPETDLNATDDQGLTALWWAILNRHLGIAKILLDREANLEVRDGDDQTPLLWAVRNRDKPLTELLLKKGASISVQDKDERTPFFWAVEHKDEEMVIFLLDRIERLRGRNQLLNYLASGLVQTRTDTVDLSHGRDGGFEDQTPLLSAVRKSFELLVQRGMEQNATDQENFSKQASLLWSTKGGQKSLLDLLLGRNIVDDKTSDQSLLEAAKTGDVHSAKLLLAAGTNLHTRNLYGETPLWWAARNGHAELVEFLWSMGGDIESKDKFGLTPLAWAVENRHLSVVKLLVGLGADIRASDKSGQTPLSRADAKGIRSLLRE